VEFFDDQMFSKSMTLPSKNIRNPLRKCAFCFIPAGLSRKNKSNKGSFVIFWRGLRIKPISNSEYQKIQSGFFRNDDVFQQ